MKIDMNDVQSTISEVDYNGDDFKSTECSSITDVEVISRPLYGLSFADRVKIEYRK